MFDYTNGIVCVRELCCCTSRVSEPRIRRKVTSPLSTKPYGSALSSHVWNLTLMSVASVLPKLSTLTLIEYGYLVEEY